MRRAIALCVVVLMLSGCGQKVDVSNLADGKCSAAQSQLVDKHISAQIDALGKKDWNLAFSYASESFQKGVTINQFIVIIQEQYLMLIENQGYQFERCTIASQMITQEVRVKSGAEIYYLTYALSLNGSKLGIEAAVVGMPVDAGINI